MLHQHRDKWNAVCACVCVYVFWGVCILECVCRSVHVCGVYTCVRACVHACVCACVCVCVCVCDLKTNTKKLVCGESSKPRCDILVLNAVDGSGRMEALVFGDNCV